MAIAAPVTAKNIFPASERLTSPFTAVPPGSEYSMLTEGSSVVVLLVGTSTSVLQIGHARDSPECLSGDSSTVLQVSHGYRIINMLDITLSFHRSSSWCCCPARCE